MLQRFKRFVMIPAALAVALAFGACDVDPVDPGEIEDPLNDPLVTTTLP